MKKQHTTFLISLFAITALIGFFLASQIASVITGQPTTKGVHAQSINTFQHRILIAHVDDLNANEPVLASLWLVILSDTEPVSVTFKALYPTVQPSTLADDLSAAFQLSGKGKLSPGFIKAVNRYQVFLDGYVLVDDAGLEELLKTVNPVNQITSSFITAKNIPLQVIFTQETQLIKNTCDQVGLQVPLAKLKDISSDHLHLELDFASFDQVQQSIDSGISPYCEIAPLQ